MREVLGRFARAAGLAAGLAGGVADVAAAQGEAAVRGRVVGPDGRPAAGAVVRTIGRWDDPEPPIVAAADAEGRFALPDSGRFGSDLGNAGDPSLVATAPGLGLGWAVHRLYQDAATIRLAPAGPPIEGRLVDVEGRPVAGATVEVVEVRVRADPQHVEGGAVDSSLGRLDALLALRWDGRGPAAARWATTTDANGRFRVEGVGPERVAVLVARAPAIAATRIYAATGAGLVTPIDREDAGVPRRLHPARFRLTVAPGRAIAGAVTAADTGRPLAGWRVAATPGPYSAPDPREDAEDAATTDADGRYLVTGLPAEGGDGWALFEPPPGQPYLGAGFRVPASAPGGAPARLDLAARRGVVVRGRVTDKVAGTPLAGLVLAGSMRDNPRLAAIPGHADSRLARCFTDADGRYEVALPPGPAVVAFRAREGRDRFIGGQGAKAIPGFEPPPTSGLPGSFRTVGEALFVNRTLFAGITVAEGAESATLDLAVESWRTVTLDVTGPGGGPVAGLFQDAEPNSMIRSEFIFGRPLRVRYLHPGASRRVTVVRRDRNLGASVVVAADGPAVVPVRLGPCGEVRGRIVRPGGAPAADLIVADGRWDGPRVVPDPAPPVGEVPWANRDLGAEGGGRFRIVGLVPGLRYRLAAATQDGAPVGTLVSDVAVGPGEVRDLGDVVVRPLPNPPPAAPAVPDGPVADAARPGPAVDFGAGAR